MRFLLTWHNEGYPHFMTNSNGGRAGWKGGVRNGAYNIMTPGLRVWHINRYADVIRQGYETAGWMQVPTDIDHAWELFASRGSQDCNHVWHGVMGAVK